MLKTIHNSLLSLIFPQQCRVCSGTVHETEYGVACRQCWSGTTLFNNDDERLCSKCGAFFLDVRPSRADCRECKEHHYEHASAAGIYEKALAAAVIDLKRIPFLAKHVKAVVVGALDRIDPAAVDIIMPVPLAAQRRAERGFNQAEVLAAFAGSVTGIAVDAASLARRRHTPIHRVGMDKRARELTVEKAFEVVRPKLIEGRDILLIDDVFTSGATASACALALKRKGAGRVNIFTLARAVLTKG